MRTASMAFTALTSLIFSVLAWSLLLAGCGGDTDRRVLPDVELPALDSVGDAPGLDVDGLTGPAVINLWATWCVPCQTELPDLQRASADRPDVRFVGVDTGFDIDESVVFLDDLGVTYDQFVDPDGELSSALEVTEIPATIIVDPAGDVRFFHQGPVSYDELIEQLDQL